jgi:MoxR-like ATPase
VKVKIVDEIAMAQVHATVAAIRDGIRKVIAGKPEVIDLAIVALLSESHLLIEDVPGVGKTTLAKALGRTINAGVQRIQFTPDLLPSDITGVSVFNQQNAAFEFRPGAVFTNIVIADEINRASPKTQSALLEAMEERRVSVDGSSYLLPRPFLVVATQNPIEMEGTYPLPESQRDRFGMRIDVGYPGLDDEIAILDSHGQADPLEELQPVTDAAGIVAGINAVNEVWIDPVLKRYLVQIVAQTRNSPDCRVGASPRASLQLLRLARAHAVVSGRDYVNPDDIRTLAVPALSHRILLSADAQLSRTSVRQVIAQAVATVPVPGRRQG